MKRCFPEPLQGYDDRHARQRGASRRRPRRNIGTFLGERHRYRAADAGIAAVFKAYKGIADLKAEDPVDIERQRMLTGSMTTIIGQLNAASATLRGITTAPKLESARADLLASADALESGYR